MSAIGHTMASRGSNPSNPKEIAHRAVTDRSQPPQQQQQQRGVQRQSASRNSSYASRKGSENLNHLLAFHLPPRIRAPPPSSARRSRRGGHSAPFNKERYVNAQYRFLVKPTGDYTAHFADSDIRLQWGDILQVLIPTLSAITEASASARAATSSSSQEFPEWLLDQSAPRVQEGATCPICLSSPSAPRMTKCGHVFCYACILHYLIVADGNSGGPATLGPSSSSHSSVSAPSTTPSRNWKRCPICWDSIYARDLKAVRWWDPKAKDDALSEDRAADHQVHDRDTISHIDFLSLRLIERPHLTTLALPQSNTWPPPASSFHATSNHSGDDPIIPPHSAPWHFQPDVLPYARFMLATPSLVVAHLRADLAALRSERESAVALGSMVAAHPASHADELGLQFIDLAILKVQEQIVKAQQELDVPSVNGTIGRAKKALEEHEQQLHNIEKKRHTSRQGSSRRTQQQQRGNRIGKSVDAAVEDVEESSAMSEAPDVVDDHSHVSDFLAVSAGSQGGVTTPLSQSAKDSSSSSSDNVTSLSSDPIPAAPLQPRSRRNVNPPAPSSSSYLFYQAASGHPIYLHPLDIKILQSEYKSYISFPRRIDVRVQSAEEGSMDEDLRKRCKYLAHLPMGADVVFIEVDWLGMVERAEAKEAERVVLEEKSDVKPGISALPSPFAARDPVVSRAALAPYEHALKQRRNRRRDRERRDDRARQKAEDEGSIASGGVPIRSARELLTADDAELGWPGSSSFGSSVRSEDSSVGGAGTAGDVANSPTFSQAALWGAERTFPMHPGAALDDDFPAALRGSPNGAEETTHPSGSSNYGSPPLRPATGTVKTVWGTHAPRAISSGSAARQEEQDHGLDDAWMELEEDYILGRRGGAVKEGRGLNRQFGESSPSTPRSVPGAATPEEGTKQGGKKAKKKKLVLTGGGGGRGR